MGSTTSQGTKIAITAGVPATQDATGYAALTYTVIKGVESIPAFGGSTDVITFTPLDGPVEKHKGPTNFGSLDIPYAADDADAGQTLLKAAAAPGNNAQYAFKITRSDGAIRYFQGRVFSSTETPGSASNVLMGNTTVEINTPIVKVAAP